MDRRKAAEHVTVHTPKPTACQGKSFLLIGLKLQAIVNDPANRYGVDAPDIQQLLKLHGSSMDMDLVRDYFRLFEKEDLLDEWLKRFD